VCIQKKLTDLFLERKKTYYLHTNRQTQGDDKLRGNKFDSQSQDRWIDSRSVVTGVCPSLSFQTTVRTTGSQTPPLKHLPIFHSNHII